MFRFIFLYLILPKASVALGVRRGLQGASRSLPRPLLDNGTDNIYSSKVSNTTWGPQF